MLHRGLMMSGGKDFSRAKRSGEETLEVRWAIGLHTGRGAIKLDSITTNWKYFMEIHIRTDPDDRLTME